LVIKNNFYDGNQTKGFQNIGEGQRAENGKGKNLSAGGGGGEISRKNCSLGGGVGKNGKVAPSV